MISTLIASVFFSVYFNMTNLHQSFKLDFKPFNCTPCLSVWSAVVFYLLPIQITELIALFFSAGVIGPYLFRLIHK